MKKILIALIVLVLSASICFAVGQS
ncbi:hypothetical protein LCGC14_2572830, partial [marine sediment metagenome]